MVFVRKVSVQDATYYYLFHIKRLKGQFRKYKKYVGMTKPTGKRLVQLKQHFLEEIKQSPDVYERPHNLNVVEILQMMQEHKGYISEEDVVKLSKELHIPAVDLVGVATFYSQFTFKKPGQYVVKVCNGTACHVKKSPELTRHISKELGIRPGEVSKDGLFGFESVNCIGACARAPAMMINNKVYGELTPAKITALLNSIQKRSTTEDSEFAKTSQSANKKVARKKQQLQSKKKVMSRKSTKKKAKRNKVTKRATPVKKKRTTKATKKKVVLKRKPSKKTITKIAKKKATKTNKSSKTGSKKSIKGKGTKKKIVKKKTPTKKRSRR